MRIIDHDGVPIRLGREIAIHTMGAHQLLLHHLIKEGVDTLLDLDGFGITLLEELLYVTAQPHMLAVQHLGIEVRPQILQRHVTKNVALPIWYGWQGHITPQRRDLVRGARRLHRRLHGRLSTTTQDMLFRAYTGDELLTWV